MNKQQALISIITVTYNCVELIEATLLSIFNQNYSNVELIIVDGASTDGTMDIVKKYEHKIATIISEPDKGLYDAMNKGLKLATGDYVWYMNAGDHIHAPDTISKMTKDLPSQTDIIYGEIYMVDDKRNKIGTRSEITPHKLPEYLIWQDMRHGMVVSHQAFLPARSICDPYMENNLSADIDWVIKCLKKSKKNYNTNLILADYLMGGTSKQQHQKSLKDRYKVLKNHFGTFNNLLNHFYIFFRAFIFKMIRIGRPSY